MQLLYENGKLLLFKKKKFCNKYIKDFLKNVILTNLAISCFAYKEEEMTYRKTIATTFTFKASKK